MVVTPATKEECCLDGDQIHDWHKTNDLIDKLPNTSIGVVQCIPASIANRNLIMCPIYAVLMEESTAVFNASLIQE